MSVLQRKNAKMYKNAKRRRESVLQKPPRAKAMKDAVRCNTSSETQEVLWQKMNEMLKSEEELGRAEVTLLLKRKNK